MTDREAIMAVYKAVEALYQELVGKPLCISVPTENGMIAIQSSGGFNDARISIGRAAQTF